MEKINGKELAFQAKTTLKGKDASSLALLHTGVTVLASAVIMLLQWVLAEGIGNTSGLSGMGTRSILQTMQTVLQWANTLLIPFWNLGFLYVALCWARDKQAGRKDLLEGFHRIGPCLSLLLNRFLIGFCVLFICVNICTYAYMATPAAKGLLEMAEAAQGDMNAFYALLEQQDLDSLLDSMGPLLILWGVLSLVILTPLMYRFRLAEYAILNHPGVRGMPAMLISAALMRRRRFQLFCLDLRFWWYYGLKLLCVVIGYGDFLLPALGVTLPMDGNAAFFVAYILSLIALLGVETCFRSQVETAYALFYERVYQAGPTAPKALPAPQNMPWDEA